ncbi:MAG: hypothetical protein ACT4OJ_03670, partial [Bacteroidota bacterium]
MKSIFTLCLTLCIAVTVFAQTDTTGRQNPPPNDTIRIGGITIIRKAGSKDREVVHDKEYKMRRRKNVDSARNLTTNWWIFDIG